MPGMSTTVAATGATSTTVDITGATACRTSQIISVHHSDIVKNIMKGRSLVPCGVHGLAV